MSAHNATSRSQLAPTGPLHSVEVATVYNIRVGHLLHGNATIGTKVVPVSWGRGNGGRDLLFGEERSHYTTYE